MLTGDEIYRQVLTGGIQITPFDERNLNPNSYNLSVSQHVLVYDKHLPAIDYFEERYKSGDTDFPVIEPLDMGLEELTTALEIPLGGMVLWPGVVYLLSTVEKTFAGDLIPAIDGRSSVGRLGVCVHVTAGFGDIGFSGHWTLEVVVPSPVVIYPFTPMCQVSFSSPTGTTGRRYEGGYQNQSHLPQPSKSFRWFRSKK